MVFAGELTEKAMYAVLSAFEFPGVPEPEFDTGHLPFDQRRAETF